MKTPFKNEEAMKIFPDEQKLRELITSRPAQQRMLKVVLKKSSSVQKNLIQNRNKEIKNPGEGKIWINMTDIFLNFNVFKRQLKQKHLRSTVHFINMFK